MNVKFFEEKATKALARCRPAAYPRSGRMAFAVVASILFVGGTVDGLSRTVVLVRHGAVDRERGGVPPGGLYGGDIDVPLSARGEAEARAAAEYVTQRWNVTSVWSSPLVRAVYGARCVADRAGCSVAELEAFREISRGTVWLRKNLNEIEEMTPGGMDRFLADKSYRPPGGAESIDDVQSRALTALRDQVLASSTPSTHANEAAVIVSHLYVTRALLSSAIPDVPIPDIDVPTASISVVQYDEDDFDKATVVSRGIKPALLAEDAATFLAAGDAES